MDIDKKKAARGKSFLLAFFLPLIALALPAHGALKLGPGMSLSLALNLDEASQVLLPLEFYLNRSRPLRQIEFSGPGTDQGVLTFEESSREGGGKLYALLPVGSVREGQYRIGLRLKSKKTIPFHVKTLLVASPAGVSIRPKASDDGNGLFLLSEADLRQFFTRGLLKVKNTLSYNENCRFPFIAGYFYCGNYHLNQFKKINYGGFNQLETSFLVPPGDKDLYYQLMELNTEKSGVSMKDAVLFQERGDASIYASRKFPNVVDYVPFFLKETGGVDSFLGLKLPAGSKVTYAVMLPEPGRNFLSFRLGYMSSGLDESMPLTKILRPFTFRVRLSCGGSGAKEWELLRAQDSTWPKLKAMEILSSYRLPLPRDCEGSRAEVTFTVDGGPEQEGPTLFLAEPALGNDRTEKRRPNFLFITADALRNDHITLGGYTRDTAPFLSELAKNGAYFRNYYVQRGLTQTSFPIVFSGLFPFHFPDSGHTLTRQKKLLPQTLTSILDREGYQSFAALDMKEFGKFFPEVHYFPHLTFTTNGNDMAKMIRTLLWLKTIDRDRPYFAWIHLSIPHIPYGPEDKYKKFSRNFTKYSTFTIPDKMALVESLDPKQGMDRELFQGIVSLYDDNIVKMDQLLAGLIVRMQKEGLLDNTLLAVSSDHGENMDEHGQFFQHGTLSNATLNVPLLLVYPTAIPQGKVVTETAMAVDILPTILDYLGIPQERMGRADGKSLRPLIEGRRAPRRPYVFADFNEKIFSIQDRRWKLIFNPDHYSYQGINFYFPYTHQLLELYDKDKDKLERHNLASEERETALLLREKVQWYRSEFSQAGSKDQDQESFSPEFLRKLERTGYLQWRKLKKPE